MDKSIFTDKNSIPNSSNPLDVIRHSNNDLLGSKLKWFGENDTLMQINSIPNEKKRLGLDSILVR